MTQAPQMRPGNDAWGDSARTDAWRDLAPTDALSSNSLPDKLFVQDSIS
jgi:hypothetical protein